MKINHFFILLGILTSAHLNAQDIYDALEYTESNVSGTARFNAMSGAFSALGGDISSVFDNSFPKPEIPEAASVFIGPADIALTIIFFVPRELAKYLTFASKLAFASPIIL